MTPILFIIKRSGLKEVFCIDKIKIALTEAFKATRGVDFDCSRICDGLAEKVFVYFKDKNVPKIDIEQIQDQIELVLMRSEDDFFDVARSFIIYRKDRERKRQEASKKILDRKVEVKLASGKTSPIDVEAIKRRIYSSSDGLGIVPDKVFQQTLNELYDGISCSELTEAPILVARTFIEKDPAYSYLAARLLLDKIKNETGFFNYKESFINSVKTGIEQGVYTNKLKQKFSLNRLADAIVPKRDNLFKILGTANLI